MRKGGQLFRKFWNFLQTGRNCSKNGREEVDAGYLMLNSERLLRVFLMSFGLKLGKITKNQAKEDFS
ncbi:MAG: hypothetical protein WAK60_01200 [Sedimentisphaerales bacterium]